MASTFSPTFFAVLSEAHRVAEHFHVTLEVIHAAEQDVDKEARFRSTLGKLGSSSEIRWQVGLPPVDAIVDAASRFQYDLLIAGALQQESGDRSFTNSVARELLRRAPCDLLLLPKPSEEPQHWQHVVFALEPGGDYLAHLKKAISSLQPERVTLAVPKNPFTAAIASSRGEEPANMDAWADGLAEALSDVVAEVDTRLVTSNTGFALCDAIEGLEADLLVVHGETGRNGPSLPTHMDWLYQVIPTRLLVVQPD